MFAVTTKNQLFLFKHGYSSHRKECCHRQTGNKKLIIKATKITTEQQI